MSVLKERKSNIFQREQHDHYVEENWCDARLFDEEGFGPKGSVILDPCCGWCRIPSAAFAAGYKTIASDIVDRGASETIHEFRELDILGTYDEAVYRWWRQAKSIITNPPFDQIADVARRCCALAEYKVAIICPVRRLPAAHSWINDLRLPLSKVWMMSPRPSMPSGEYISNGGKVGGGQTDFCWLIFAKTPTPPTIRWLHRDGGPHARGSAE